MNKSYDMEICFGSRVLENLLHILILQQNVLNRAKTISEKNIYSIQYKLFR